MMNDSVENFSMLFHGGLKIRTCNDIDPKHFVLNCFAAERFLFVLPEQQFLLLFLSDLHCCQFSDFAA